MSIIEFLQIMWLIIVGFTLGVYACISITTAEIKKGKVPAWLKKSLDKCTKLTEK